ncbi:MAG: DeoR/GlpR family DNA-binding transcription regulator [Coriobacteriales bacterium]|nr:DeoR/GlpR family DNA-binding transcription regulator [Coriobacteriales bacterium]
MIAEERLTRIEAIVNERGVVSVPQLMDELNASESTVRRDLLKLDKQGLVTKVHGGATRVREDYVLTDQSLAGRHALHMAEKRAIGAYAATLIGPDDFVFIDGGTTTECLVEAITETRATYLTNSLPHAQHLLAKGCRTLLPGGEVKPVTEVLVGAETVNAIRRYHFTVGFWGTNGAGLETGFTTPEFSEAAVKQISLEHTVHPYVLCDSSKLSRISLITFAEFMDATVITNRLQDSANAYRMAGNVVEVEEQ